MDPELEPRPPGWRERVSKSRRDLDPEFHVYGTMIPGLGASGGSPAVGRGRQFYQENEGWLAIVLSIFEMFRRKVRRGFRHGKRGYCLQELE